MKVTVNVECSPEEARAFLGLPDVAPMQQALMAELEEQMRQNMRAMTPENMMKTWLPAGIQNVEQAQKLFWSQMQQTMTGIASSASDAMTAFSKKERMIYAETEHLYLRALGREELPRLTQLLDVWDIARFLSVLPFPYTLKDAEEFYADIAPHDEKNLPQFYALALKSDNLLIGGIALHQPRMKGAQAGEMEIGYWLARDFWGRGLMSEAARATVELAFARPEIAMLGAVTSTTNIASQKILSKAGFKNLGECKRDYSALRGEEIILRWLLTRGEYQA